MKQRRNVSTVGWVIGLLLVTLFVVWPLGVRGFFISDDGDWMIIRLSAFYQSLREGQFPVRFLGRLNYGYGYPVANFLYPGFLYVGSFIKSFGFSFVDTTKIILAGSVIGASLCLFFWLRRRFSALSSFLGAIGFVFSPYLAFDLYTRGSVGEIVAFFAAALALFSMDRRVLGVFPLPLRVFIDEPQFFSAAFFFDLPVWSSDKRKEYWPYVFWGWDGGIFWLPALFDRRYVVFDAQAIANPASYLIGGNTFFLLNIVPAIAGFVLANEKK